MEESNAKSRSVREKIPDANTGKLVAEAMPLQRRHDVYVEQLPADEESHENSLASESIKSTEKMSRNSTSNQHLSQEDAEALEELKAIRAYQCQPHDLPPANKLFYLDDVSLQPRQGKLHLPRRNTWLPSSVGAHKPQRKNWISSEDRGMTLASAAPYAELLDSLYDFLFIIFGNLSSLVRWGIAIGVLAIGLVFLLWNAPSSASNFENIALCRSQLPWCDKSSIEAKPVPNNNENIRPGEHPIVGSPTIDANRIDAILLNYSSPAHGTGQVWIEMGEHYGIDPIYALAFFIQESTAGTNPGWAGVKSDGTTTHNVGNIICAGYATCYNGHRDYPSWEAGIQDWYRLIAREYVEGRGVSTLEQIVPIYCPTSDGCSPDNYVQVVNNLIHQWNQGNLSP